MTSCSPRADAVLALGAALALAGVAAGCKAERVVETQVLVFAESRTCLEMPGPTRPVMNSYQARLYEFEGVDASAPTMSPCLDCLVSGRCRPVSTQCQCGRSVPVGTLALNQELAGLRFTDLDPGKRYCIALFGFDQPGLVPPGPTMGPWPCECSGPDAGAAASLRLCGISPFPGSLDENAAAIIVTSECLPPGAPGCPYPVGPE